MHGSQKTFEPSSRSVSMSPVTKPFLTRRRATSGEICPMWRCNSSVVSLSAAAYTPLVLTSCSTLYSPRDVFGIWPRTLPLGEEIVHTPLEKVVVHPASSIRPIETSVYPTSGEYRTSVRRMVEVSVPLGTSTNKSPTSVALKDCWFVASKPLGGIAQKVAKRSL